jgi:hypothetical protein
MEDYIRIWTLINLFKGLKIAKIERKERRES